MKTLAEVLCNELSPDKVKDMPTDELVKFLLENKIVATEPDIRMLVIEGIQKAAVENDEFPIHYYPKDEDIPEEHKIVDPGPCLTDEYIENNLIP